MMLPMVQHEENSVVGEVLWVDHFGNAQTNVAPVDLAAIGLEPRGDVAMVVGGAEHRLPWVEAYAQVPLGEALLHVDSYGQIAVAVREGRADEAFGLAPRTSVTFRAPDSGDRLQIVADEG